MGGGRWRVGGVCSGVRAARSLIFLKDAEGRNPDVLRAAGAQSRLHNRRRCCVGFCFSQVGPEGISGELPGRAPAALTLSLTHSFWSTRLTPGRCTTSPSGVGGWGGGCHSTSGRGTQRFFSLVFLFLARHLTLSSASGAAGG